MNLPNTSHAVVDLEKIDRYLLNEAHPDNGGKAGFFHLMGFHREKPEVLAGALRKFAQIIPVTRSIRSLHGVKYILDGALQTPSGRTPMIRTVWIIDHGSATARLVTAYPIPETTA